jgi:hypothetical protein
MEKPDVGEIHQVVGNEFIVPVGDHRAMNGPKPRIDEALKVWNERGVGPRRVAPPEPYEVVALERHEGIQARVHR